MTTVLEIALEHDHEYPSGQLSGPPYFQVATFERDEHGIYVPDSLMPQAATYDFEQALAEADECIRLFGIDAIEFDLEIGGENTCYTCRKGAIV